MPAPRWLAEFNRSVTNRISRPLARRLPGFGVVVHTGRKSGREYRTPVNVFPRDGGYVIALTYGRNGEWVRNCWRAAPAGSKRGANRCGSRSLASSTTNSGAWSPDPSE